MCDYSLACFPNRLAVEGEQLVVHRFQTGALGLASPCPDLKQILFPSSTPAVCVHLEGPEMCSSCGQYRTVLMVENN